MSIGPPWGALPAAEIMSSIFLFDALYASLCACSSSAVGGGANSSSCAAFGAPGCSCVCALWLGGAGAGGGGVFAAGGVGCAAGFADGFSSSATCASGRGSPSVPNLRRSVTTNSAFFSAIHSSFCLEFKVIQFQTAGLLPWLQCRVNQSLVRQQLLRAARTPVQYSLGLAMSRFAQCS